MNRPRLWIPSCRRMRPGFTFIELVAASILMAAFITLVFGQLSALARATGRAGRGAAELAAAARLAGRFREDVRAARSAAVSPDGARVTLALPAGPVEYGANAEGRLERGIASGEKEAGPLVRELRFELKEKKNRRLLHAVWTCLAETDPNPAFADPATGGGQVLVLETALRIDGEGR